MQKIRNGPGRSRKLWPNVRYADTLAEVGKCQIITTGAQQIDEFLSPGILIGETLNISSVNGGKWGELNYFCQRLLNRTLS